MNFLEKRIVTTVVDEALSRGYSMSIDCEGEEVVGATADRGEILANIDGGDDALVSFYPKGEDRAIGNVYFVYGNDDGSTVISDHTDTPAVRELLAKAEAIARSRS